MTTADLEAQIPAEHHNRPIGVSHRIATRLASTIGLRLPSRVEWVDNGQVGNMSGGRPGFRPPRNNVAGLRLVVVRR